MVKKKAKVNIYKHSIDLSSLKIKNQPREKFREALESKESTLQSEIKEAIASGDPSKLTAMFDKVNRLSSMSREDKRQLRALEEKEDSLLGGMRLAAAKNDTVSISVLERELNKVREKIRRLKE